MTSEGRPRRAQTRRGRPKGGNADETRRKILDVAIAHFAERGYASATLSAIAAEVGLSTSAMYHYYDGKETLYEAAFFDVAPAVWDEIGREIQGKSTVQDAVEHLLRGRGGRRSPYASGFLAAVPTVAVLHPEFEHLLTARTKFQTEVFRSIAEIGMETGELAAFTIDEATDVLRSVVMGWFFERYFEGESRDATIAVILKLLALVAVPSPDRATNSSGARRSTSELDS